MENTFSYNDIKTINLPITKITLLIGGPGSETAFFDTNIKEGIWPFKNNARLKLDIAKGNGIDYIKKNFKNIELFIINIDNGNTYSEIV